MVSMKYFLLFISFFLMTAFVLPDKEINSIDWLSWEELQQKQQNNPKKVFVDVYTSWCYWCKKMDKETFTHPDIISYINENFYAVKFDAETEDVIEFKGQKYKFVKGGKGKRGYNELAASLLSGNMSYPTLVFLDEKLNLLTGVPSYATPSSLDAMLHFFNEEQYKNTKWADFEETFKSKIEK